MICREFEAVVTDYLEGKLEAPREFEAHLASCGACRLYLQQMRATILALGRLPALAPPEALRREVVAAFERRWGSKTSQPARMSTASGRMLSRLEAQLQPRFGWALSGLAIAVSFVLAWLSEPGVEIGRAGAPRICLPIELAAGVLPALALFALCRRERQRLATPLFAAVAAGGALMAQLLLFAACPMLDSRAHTLAIHAGGVIVAILLGAAVGHIPVPPASPRS